MKVNSLCQIGNQKSNIEIFGGQRTVNDQQTFTDRELTLYESLYRPSVDHELLESEEYNHFLVSVNGIVLKQEEISYSVRVTIQGDLGDLSAAIIEELKKRLEEIENTEYLIKRLR